MPAQIRVEDVFTPTRPARLTFVEREAVNAKLVGALQTPGKQIVVYGHSGSGKTTLLVNKLEQLYEAHVTTRCVSHMTFEHVVLHAFDQLSPFYTSEITSGSIRSLAATYTALRSEISATYGDSRGATIRRSVPPQLTPQLLAQMIGAAKKCWVLEDFHKLPRTEKQKLAQVMKVFMDTADEYPEVRLIAIGAVDTAREIVEYDSEMRNRVAEIHVPLMTPLEIEQIPAKGQQHLNLSIPRPIVAGIVRYANGLAAVCHSFCLNICRSAGVVEPHPATLEVGDGELSEALDQYLEEASDTLKSAFDRAFRRERQRRYDNCRLIIEALTRLPEEGATHGEILAEIRKQEEDYPSGNLTTYLRELQTADRGSLLRHHEASNRFSFADPIFRAFAMVKTRKAQRKGDPGELRFAWDERSARLLRDHLERLLHENRVRTE